MAPRMRQPRRSLGRWAASGIHRGFNRATLTAGLFLPAQQCFPRSVKSVQGGFVMAHHSLVQVLTGTVLVLGAYSTKCLAQRSNVRY
jgi:hypothetical protein